MAQRRLPLVLDGPAEQFRCEPLSATIPVRTCLARQEKARSTERTVVFGENSYTQATGPHLDRRGTMNTYGTCRHCAQGQAMRQQVCETAVAIPLGGSP